MSKDQDTVDLALALQALTFRYEVLAIAVQESLRALGEAQAGHCAQAIRVRVEALASLVPLHAAPKADEAIAQELAGILSSLERPSR